MTDRFTREERSAIMSRVKGRNTQPEMAVRRALHRMGFRYRLHASDLPGRPDIVLPRHRKVVLVHGCFWHGHEGCPRAARPSANADFWAHKLDANIHRDAEVREQLHRLGWQVLTVWQCEARDLAGLERRLRSFMMEGQEAMN